MRGGRIPLRWPAPLRPEGGWAKDRPTVTPLMESYGVPGLRAPGPGNFNVNLFRPSPLCIFRFRGTQAGDRSDKGVAGRSVMWVDEGRVEGI